MHFCINEMHTGKFKGLKEYRKDGMVVRMQESWEIFFNHGEEENKRNLVDLKSFRGSYFKTSFNHDEE